MKNSKKGITLIVLIITIIVIVILATAILVSVINNNPISEANKARYESDRDNMQAVFTNTVGKIMAQNQGVVNVTAGQINTETTGVNEATGEVAYTVDNATVAANASGKIVFDKGTNNATTYYTGKKLPIYAAGETKWYVDSEGVLLLEVAGVKYGSGEVENGSGSGSEEEETLAPGLYKPDGTFVSWENLISEEYCIVGWDGCSDLCMQEQAILEVNEDGVLRTSTDILCCAMETQNFSSEHLVGKLVLDNSVKTLLASFAYCENLTEIVIPNSVTDIGEFAFYNCTNLTSITIGNNVTKIDYLAFGDCLNLTSITIGNNVTKIDCWAFGDCLNLTSINYTGTQEEWNNINLVENYYNEWGNLIPGWNAGCPEITVHCTDGDIIIPAWTESE